MTKNWYTDFNMQMFNRIKTRIQNMLGEKYTGLNIVRYEDSSGLAQFPTVYIPDPTSKRSRRTLEITSPDGIEDIMYQPEVYTTNENQAETISNAVDAVFGNTGFEARQRFLQMESGSPDVIRLVGKFYKRAIDKNDIL